jgi:low affinity Fe/Cu permease
VERGRDAGARLSCRLALWINSVIANTALHAKLDELLRINDDARSELTQLDEQEPEIIERHRGKEKREAEV